MNQSRHSSMIDLLRFIFAMMIVLFHFNSVVKLPKPLFNGGNLGVEFFFLLSGYLMAVSATRKPHDLAQSAGRDTRDFIARKISHLMPDYYLTWLMAFLTRELIINKNTLASLAGKLASQIPELLFIVEGGLALDKGLQITWYISAMLLVMLACYPLLRRYEDFFLKVAAPCLTAVLLAGGYYRFASLNGSHYLIWGLFFKTMYRALMGILGGCTVFTLSQMLKKLRSNRATKMLFTLLEVALYGAIVAYYALSGHQKADFGIFVLTAMALMVTVSGISASENIASNFAGFFSFLGKLSLPLYLAHAHWIKLLPRSNGFLALSFSRQLPIYLAVSLASGLVTMCLSHLLKAFWRRYRKPVLSRLLVSEEDDH